MPENNIERALLAIDNVPVGTIVAWAGPSNLVPQGWLICNGDQVYQNQFPSLCAIIQDYWGPSNNAGQHILPDLRAMFLRGINGSRNDSFSDPQKNDRNSQNGNPNNVGSLQHDCIQGHWHINRKGPGGAANWGPQSVYDGNTFAPSNKNNNVSGGQMGWDATDIINDGTNGSPRISSETRPNNAYVYYIIKAI